MDAKYHEYLDIDGGQRRGKTPEEELRVPFGTY